MTESHTANASGTWSVPQCPLSIEYSLRVMDDIRLAVMDAFFSLPRGGAEIGGILLGSRAEGRVTISDYLPLDCEHAFGPSFTLSPRDEAQLRDLLESARAANGTAPVGWYHSHTRSEIFLSDADLTIHKRFFPEPWQVALVMKPHTFQPMRCGFFLRDSNGAMQAAATYREFTLDAQPMRPLPSGAVPKAAETMDVATDEPAVSGVTSQAVPSPAIGENGAAVDATAAAAKPDAAGQPRIIAPPRFVDTTPERSWNWLKVLLATALGLGLGAAGYQTRQLWWPRFTGIFTPADAVVTYAPIGLSTIDTDGQLQIHWDRYSSTVREATAARLSITDVGPDAREIQLDPARLQSGNFTYAREGESVTVVLTLDEPNGRQAHEVSTFLGKLPKAPAAADVQDLRKQRDALAQESARLRQELAAEVERNRRLQKALEGAAAQLKGQANKRLGNQIPK